MDRDQLTAHLYGDQPQVKALAAGDTLIINDREYAVLGLDDNGAYLAVPIDAIATLVVEGDQLAVTMASREAIPDEAEAMRQALREIRTSFAGYLADGEPAQVMSELFSEIQRMDGIARAALQGLPS